jgi:hypothetical protein
MATFWVSPSGSDSWPGGWLCPLQTVHEAVSRAGAWAAAHPDEDVQVRLRAGVYPISAVVEVGFPRLSIRGAGVGRTILRGAGDGHWQIRVIGGHRFALSHLTLHTDTADVDASSVWIEASDDVVVHHVHVTQIRFWGILIGTSDGCSTVPVNQRARVEDCVFDQSNPATTTEALLVFNTHDVQVTRCAFRGIPLSGIGLGLFQVVSAAVVTECSFFGAGTGAYYPVSGVDLTFRGCTFQTRDGLTGANQSDNGPQGSTHTERLTVEGCRFSSHTEGHGLQLGAVHRALVVGCTFTRCDAIAIVIDLGNDLVPHAGLDFVCGGAIPPEPPRELRVLANTFDDNNPFATFSKIHPDVLIQHLPTGHHLDLEIAGNTFTSPHADHHVLTALDEGGLDGTYAGVTFEAAANTFNLDPDAVIVSGTLL